MQMPQGRPVNGFMGSAAGEIDHLVQAPAIPMSPARVNTALYTSISYCGSVKKWHDYLRGLISSFF
jgi:hypothetical protein